MGQFSSLKTTETNDDKFPFPKVELHLHLDGCIRFSTVLELGLKKGVDLHGATTLEELKKVLVTRKPSSLADVLAAFEIFLPTIVGDLEAIERVAYEMCEDQARDGIIYFEGRYCAQFLADEAKQITPKDVIKAVYKGFERGEKEFGIKGRSILCCIRGHDVWNAEIVNLAYSMKDYGVVAIDAAGCAHGADERYEPSVVDAFREAQERGIHRTLHAGESSGASAVIRAVEEMHSERIGHGYHLLDDEVAYKKYAIEKRIHLEACPLSSVLTGSVPLDWPNHPVVRWAADGANFSLSTDDPTCFDNSFASELNLVHDKIGLSILQIWQCQLNAAESAFISEPEKSEIIKRIKDAKPADI